MDAESDGAKRRAVSRVVLWVGGGFLALLLTLGFVNLLAPRAVERVLVGAPTPLVLATPSQPKAAIIDQTGLSFPTPDFLAEAEAYLVDAGYAVDQYPPEVLTVDFYRTLPVKGYDLILFQTHATSEVMLDGEDEQSSRAAPGPFLFTTEEYAQQRYLRLQLEDQVRASRLFFEGSPLLFALGPKFVDRSMRGTFANTVIIIGGCQSLAVPDLAQAFLDRGASVVIGWDEMVNLSHNNAAMLALLEGLMAEGLSAPEAVERTMEAVGPDPSYDSSLVYLQPELGG
jgi:hypothetical protein